MPIQLTYIKEYCHPNLCIQSEIALQRPVDFQIERNKKIAIRGVNGLGKTTLLKTILGLLKPVSGELIDRKSVV